MGELEWAKICTKCGEEKPFSEFHKARDCKFGVRAHCKACACRDAVKSHHVNRDRVLTRQRERRHADPAAARAYHRRWSQENREKRAAYKRRWIEESPDAYRASVMKSHLKRQQVVRRRIEAAIRAGLQKRVRGERKSASTFALLGFTANELMAHLERQFVTGMTWENYGKWHVDHIVPLSSFDYQRPEGPAFKAAWALCNLRPLWASENLAKGAQRQTLL